MAPRDIELASGDIQCASPRAPAEVISMPHDGGFVIGFRYHRNLKVLSVTFSAPGSNKRPPRGRSRGRRGAMSAMTSATRVAAVRREKAPLAVVMDVPKAAPRPPAGRLRQHFKYQTSMENQ